MCNLAAKASTKMKTIKTIIVAIMTTASASALAELEADYVGCLAYHWVLSISYDEGSTPNKRHANKMKEVIRAGIDDGYDQNEIGEKAVFGLYAMKKLGRADALRTAQGMEEMCRKLGKL